MNKEPLEDLTTENASRVNLVINKRCPEWGSKKFNFQGQPLNEGDSTHTVGTGPNSSLLFENEFKFWSVVSFND